jgi:hypothetical protein
MCVVARHVKNAKPACGIFAAALPSVFPLSASETLAIGHTPYALGSTLKSETIALR